MIIGGVKRPAVVRARRKQTPVSSFVPSRPEVSVGRPRHVAPHPVARAKVISRPPPAPRMQPTGRTRGGGRSYQSPDAARDTVKALRTLRVINPKTGHIRIAKKVQRFSSVEDWRFKSARAAQVRATTDAVIKVRRAQGASAIQIADELIAMKKPRIRNDFAITENRFKRQAQFHQQYGYGPDARHDMRVDRGLESPHGSALTKILRTGRDTLLGLPATLVELGKSVPELGQSQNYLRAKAGMTEYGPKGVNKPHTPHVDAQVKAFEKHSQQYAIADRLYHDPSLKGLKKGLREAHKRGADDPTSYLEWAAALGVLGRVASVAKHGSEAAATARSASYAGRAAGASAKGARKANTSSRLAVQSQRELTRLMKLRKQGRATDAQVEAAARKAEHHGKAALPPKSATAVRARRYSRSPYVRVVQKAGEEVQHRLGRDSRYKRGRAADRIVKRSTEGARRRAHSGGLGVETDVSQAIGKQKLVNHGIVFKNHAAQRLHNAAVRFSHTGEVMRGRELHDLREIRDTIDAHIKEATKEAKGEEVLGKLRANRAIVEKLASDFARHGADSHVAKARKITHGKGGSKELADALDQDLVDLGYVTKEQAQFRRKSVRQFTHGNAAMGKRPDEREGVDFSSLSSEALKALEDNPDRSAAVRAGAREARDARTGLRRERVRAEKRTLRATRLKRERQKVATGKPAGRSEAARPKDVPQAKTLDDYAHEGALGPGDYVKAARERQQYTGESLADALVELHRMTGKAVSGHEVRFHDRYEAPREQPKPKKAEPKKAEPKPVKAAPKPKPAPHSGRDREHAMVDTVHGYRAPRDGEVYVGRRTSEAETPFGNWVAAHKRSPAGVKKVADANTAIRLWHEAKRGDDAFIKRGPELVGKRLLYPSRTKDLSHADVLGHWAERIRKLPDKERTLERLRQEFDGALEDWHGDVKGAVAEKPGKGWHRLSSKHLDRSKVEKVIITGDRGRHTTPAEMKAWAAELFDSLGPGRGRTFVHGDAKGVDKTLGAEAKRRGWKVEAHPAPWDDVKGKPASEIRSHADGRKYWVKAGPARNQTMRRAHPPDGRTLVVAMHGDLAKSKGTLDMASASVDEGYPVMLRTREGSVPPSLHEPQGLHPPTSTRPGRATTAGGLPAGKHIRHPTQHQMALRHQFQSIRKGAQRGKPQLNWPTAKLEKEARKLVASGKHPERLNAMLLELEERRAYIGAGKRPGEIPKLLAALEKKHKQPELGRAEAIQELRENLSMPDEATASAETEPLHKLFDHWASKLNGTERSLRREGQHVGDAGLYHQEGVLVAISNVVHALEAGNAREAAVAARDVIEEISANAHVERMRQLERSQPDAADNPWIGEHGSRMPNKRAVGKPFEMLDAIRRESPSGRYTVGANTMEKEGGVRGERQAGELFAGRRGKGTPAELSQIPNAKPRQADPNFEQPPLNVEHARDQALGGWTSPSELPRYGELDEADRPDLSSGEDDFGKPRSEANSGWEEYHRGAVRAAEAKVRKLARKHSGSTQDDVQLEFAKAALAAARAEELPVPVAEAIANAVEDRLVARRGHKPPAAETPKSARVKAMEESGDFAEVRSKRETGVAGRIQAARRDFRKARSTQGLAEAIFKHRNVLRLRYTDAQLREIAKRVGRELSKEDGWFNVRARNRFTRPDELAKAIESVLGPPRHAGDHADLYAHLADVTEKVIDKDAEVAMKEWWKPYFRRDVGDSVKRGMRLTSKSPVHEGSTFHFRPRADRPGLAREKSSGQGFTGRSAIYEDMGAADIKSSLLHQARARGQAMLSKAMLSFSYHGKAVPAHTVDLAELEAETGFGWSLVKARRRDQPGTLTPRLEGMEEHSSLFAKPARDDMVYAVPTATVDVWAKAVKRPGALVQSGQWITRQFVRGVLPFAATWHAGNYADQQLRLMAMGPGAIAHGSEMAKALRARLSEGDLPPGLQHDVMGFALGHFGTWSSVPKLRLAEIFEGKRVLGSFGEAATRTVARRGHDGWEPRFFAKALAKPQDLALHLGGRWEQGPIMRQLGGHARAQYKRMYGDVADLQTMADTLVRDWREHPHLLEEFQREVLQTAGDWAKNNNAELWAAAGPLPFVKWMQNALKWTLWTLPTRHPNALMAATFMSMLTREQRARLGLEYWHTPQELYRQGLPKPQLFGNVVIGGKAVYLGGLFSPSEAGQFVNDPAQWGASKLLPMVQGPVAAAMTGNRYFEGSDVANPQRDVWSAKQARKDIELVQHTLQSHGGGPVWILKGSTPYKYRILRYENGAPVIYEIHGRRKKWDKQPYNAGILGRDYARGLLQAGLQFLPGQKELTSHNILPGTYGHWRITGRRLGSSIYNPAPSFANRAALKGEGNRLGKGWSKADDIRYSTPDSPFRVGSLEDDRKRKAKVAAAKRIARQGERRYAKNVAKLKETRRSYAVKAKKVQADYGPQGLLERFHFRPEGTSERGPTLRQINKPVPVKVVKRPKWKVKQAKRRRAEHVAHAHGRLTPSEKSVVKYFDDQVSYRSQKIAQAKDFAGRIPGWWLAEKHFRPDGTKLYDPPLAAQQKRVDDYKRRRAKVVAKAHPRKRALVAPKVARY